MELVGREGEDRQCLYNDPAHKAGSSRKNTSPSLLESPVVVVLVACWLEGASSRDGSSSGG